MAEKSVRRGSTRHHRVEERFAGLLEEDFGLRAFHARALIGVPMKQALAVCEWAESRSADTDERGEMVRAWARNRGVGRYDRRLNDPEPPTFGGHEARGV